VLNTKTKIFFGSFILVFSLFIFWYFSSQIKAGHYIQKPPAALAEPRVLGQSTTTAETVILPKKPQFIDKNLPELKNITAKSYLIFNEKTEQNLLESEINLKLGIASLTKLLTAYVAYKNLDLNSVIKISYEDLVDTAPILGLRPNDEVVSLDLFNAMLIGSANDAAKALANQTTRVTGLNFVETMNFEAKSLGMQNSNFSNPMGFDSDRNFSTANDLKKIILATQQLGAFKNVSRYRSYAFKEATLKKAFKIESTNKLIASHPEIEAIKTGYTDNSLGALAIRVNTQSASYVILVLGSKDRETDALTLENILLSSIKDK
jgi:D-alanyl-D-alanine carboxypeptidase